MLLRNSLKWLFLFWNLFLAKPVETNSPLNSKPSSSFLSLFSQCEITLFGDILNNDKYLNYFSTTQQVPVRLQSVIKAEFIHNKRDLGHASSSHFVPCRATFYFLHEFLSSRGNSINFKLLTKNLEGQVRDNPQYIVFVKSSKYRQLVPQTGDNVQSEQSFYANLYRTTLTSKFFVIDESLRSVSMVCLHCPSTKVLDSFSDFSSMDAVDRRWKLTHANLGLRSVEILRRRDERLQHPEQCSMRHMIRTIDLDQHDQPHNQLDTDLCSVIEVSRALNITPYRTDHRLYGHVKYGTVMYADLVDSLFLNPQNPAIYEWSTTAEAFESVTFITVAQKVLDIKAIWHPFSKSVWISLAVGFVSLALCFGISISSRYEVAKTHFINAKFSFVLFTAILLEQKQLILFKVRKQLSRSSIVIVTTWTLVAFVYSLLYRSSIYTVISTLLPPHTPGTLLELPDSGFHIATTTTYQLQGEFQSPVLTALDEALEPRVSVNGTGGSGTSTTNTSKLQALRQAVQFVPARPAELLNSYVTALRTFKPTVAVPNHHNGSADEYHIPRTFVLVGPEPELRIVSQLFTFYSRYVFVIKSTDSGFVHRTPWVVRRNFFSGAFHRRLAALYENGIIQQWRTSGLIRSLEQEWLATDAATLVRPGSNHALRLFHLEKDSRLHSEPWPIAAFATVLYLWIICLDYCCTIFFLEWAAILILRKCFRIRRNAIRHMKIDEP